MTKYKILLIDDDAYVLDLFKRNFPDCIIDYRNNPIDCLDEFHQKKDDLFRYDMIFVDYHFRDLLMTAPELNISRNLRKMGFQNYIILISIQSKFDWEYLKNKEFFDAVLDKDVLPTLKQILSRCKNSSYTPAWKLRFENNTP